MTGRSRSKLTRRAMLAAAAGAVLVVPLVGRDAARLVSAQLRNGRPRIREFGAVGDGIADDTQAIEQAIASGRPLDWEDLTYRVTRQVGDEDRVIAGMDWIAAGARVVLDSSAHHQAVLHYRLAPDVAHNLVGGGLAFDARMRANVGAFLWQPVAPGRGSLHAERLQAFNIRRIARFGAGDGVRIRGGFARVTLVEPTVRNVVLGRGAGVRGSVGVTGITVSRGIPGQHGWPRFIHVLRPTIEDVLSEDPDYRMDQDGLRLFGQADAPGRGYDECLVEGGLWRNCWGRDIKVQMGGGRVTGGRFEHWTSPRNRTARPSIDFQTGPGLVENVTHLYDGVSPAALVSQATGRHGEARPGIYRGSSYEIRGARAQSLCYSNPRGSTFPGLSIVDISGTGPAGSALRCNLPDGSMAVDLRSVAGTFTRALIEVLGRGGAGGLRVIAEGCVNRGPARVPLVAGRVPRGIITDVEGLSGFI